MTHATFSLCLYSYSTELYDMLVQHYTLVTTLLVFLHIGHSLACISPLLIVWLCSTCQISSMPPKHVFTSTQGCHCQVIVLRSYDWYNYTTSCSSPLLRSFLQAWMCGRGGTARKTLRVVKESPRYFPSRVWIHLNPSMQIHTTAHTCYCFSCLVSWSIVIFCLFVNRTDTPL